MAKVSKNRDKQRENAWRIRWTQDGKRRSLFWRGREAEAEEARQHIAHLVDCQEYKQPPATVTLAWLRELDHKRHDRLAELGLAQGRHGGTGRTLAALIDAFIAAQKSVTEGTRKTYNQARTSLEAYFGADRRIESITKAEARAFREWLAMEGNEREKERTDLDLNQALADRPCYQIGRV